MRIIFFAIPEYTKPVLDALNNAGYEIVKIICSKNNLNFEEFKELKPDLCIVAAYGKFIPSKYLSIPKYGFINIHPSLLPKYRGPSPIKTAILNGDTETGVTLMLVDKEMDHGPILSSIKYQTSGIKYHKEIEKDLWDLGTKLLIETLPHYISGKIKPKEQNHSQATFTKKLNHEDGRIDWSQSAEKIYNQIRALSEEPGAWTMWQNKILNIRQADLYKTEPCISEVKPPGTIISVDNEIAVATNKCYLILKTIQLEGRKETDVKSFVNGHPNFINSKLE